jgi:hypothetical protein
MSNFKTLFVTVSDETWTQEFLYAKQCPTRSNAKNITPVSYIKNHKLFCYDVILGIVYLLLRSSEVRIK